MSKHIKFAATPVAPDFQKVKVTILEQTHRGAGFGSGFSYEGSRKFRASNGVELRSYLFPEDNSSDNKVAMRGTSVGCDNRVLTFSAAFYKKFKEAVEEYNRVNAPAAPVVPKLAPCTVIVG